MGKKNKTRTTSAKMSRLLSRFPASGLSVKEFCKKRRISQAQYYYWQRRLKTVLPSVEHKVRPSFVRVSKLDLATSAGHYELFLADGLRLRIPADFNRESLSTLLSVVLC